MNMQNIAGLVHSLVPSMQETEAQSHESRAVMMTRSFKAEDPDRMAADPYYESRYPTRLTTHRYCLLDTHRPFISSVYSRQSL